MRNNYPHALFAKYNRQVITVTQDLSHIQRLAAYLRKNAAFEEWRKKLDPSDRLPRGKFFRGKKPERKILAGDEMWQTLG